MAKLHTLLLIALCSTTWIGCGGSEDSTEPTGSDSGSAAVGTPNHPVAQVVHDFLEAVRLGDTESASRRLTPLALQRTSEMDMNFSPPGSETASFRVGQVEMVDPERAIVQCIWSDLDADGNRTNEQITWALKLTGDQWRISGMAAEVGEGQPPVVMDFENPGEMFSPGPQTPSSPQTPRQANSQVQDPFQQPTTR